MLKNDVEREAQVRERGAHGIRRPQVPGRRGLARDPVVVEQIFGQELLGNCLVALARLRRANGCTSQRACGYNTPVRSIGKHGPPADDHPPVSAGLLSLRPWSAYELVAQMRRSLDLIWPRAQSNLYADLKRLAEQGLATGQAARSARSRTTTPSPRKAGPHSDPGSPSPARPPVFECEALVKLAYVAGHSQSSRAGSSRGPGQPRR